MLNQKFFKKIKAEYELYGSERRKLISESNEALALSKQAIFALHRDDVERAGELLKTIENIFENLEKRFERDEELRGEGAYRAATEEYAEAKLFFNFLREKKIDEIKEIKVDLDSYLGGLCDLTGEILRKAIASATKRKFDEVEEFKKAIESIMQELIEMNLTGYLRTKYDQAKNNMRKIEEIMYDISIRK
jgi:translin